MPRKHPPILGFHIIAQPNSADSIAGQITGQAITRLQQRFVQVRQATEQLTAALSEEDCALQSMPDASPTKWHLAHTSWFFETFVLEPFQPDFTAFDASYRVLFNSYYNGVGEKHPRTERGLISRPTLAAVRAYRQHVTHQITQLLPELAGNPAVVDLVWLGCNHEEQHQELILTDLKHLLSRNPQHPAYDQRWPLTAVEAKQPHWIDYAGGLVEIGFTGGGFAFDNETPRHKVWLPPFQLASHPVTHGDFAAFIADGGYARAELWLALGWDWVTSRTIEYPMYWQRATFAADEGQPEWQTFTLHGMVPIDPQAPMCHINYFEADAYARWAGARLPREAEWELAASTVPQTGNFLDSGALHPLALQDEPPAGQPAQMFGDVWEWTQSAYLPYPGFHPAAGAVGEYNGKFMCNQFVLRGGSCATPSAHMRPTYRNFFPPEARWQFSGIRLARDA